MSRPQRSRPSEIEAIEATAAAWLAERDGGLTPDDEANFAAWRAADPRHEAAVARLEATWAALQSLREYRPEARAHPDTDLLHSRHGRAVGRRFVFPALVSTGLAALLVFALFWRSGLRPSDPVDAPETYVTTADGYQRVALEDGSVVELNASSEVTVRFTPAQRRVRLVRGEAHFTVAKNPARPFLVDAGDVAVRAVGTAFNVRLGTRDVEVLVTEGKVDLGPSAALAEAASAAASESDGRPPAAPAPTRVNANERAIVTAPEPSASQPVSRTIVEKVEPDALREALAWQGPRLVFVDTPLAEVVSQFNRRNHVQLVLADPELAALPVGGSFRAENLDGFVRLLTSDREIVAERPDASHIVLHRK